MAATTAAPDFVDEGLSHAGDITVLTMYFIFIVIVGFWASCKRSTGNVRGYFLAGRTMIWWPVGASLYVSNIGSEHLIGLAGTGASSGVSVIMYEWMSAPLVMLLAWVFLPVYVTSGVYTLPEYLQRRFGGTRLSVYMSSLSIVLYVVTKIAVCIYAGGLFIQVALGWNIYLSITLLVVLTCVITAAGGLSAVIHTDALQSCFIVIGGLILSIIAMAHVGGYESLKSRYFDAAPTVTNSNNTCGEPRQDAFHIFRPINDPESPWLGMVLQTTIGCMWYWCSDQVIVQRALAAKDIRHAKGGAIMTGYLKLLPMFFILLPGMVSRALFPDEVGCSLPEECMRICGNPLSCSNIAYPKLVLSLMPVGLRGLMFAVMLAAIMSSLTSIFNSASTLFTLDIYRKIRREAKEGELLLVGKLFIVLLCVVSIAWVPLVQSSQGGQLWQYIQSVQALLGTPVGALFTMSILWSRMNEKGAFCGILVGHASGITRMVLDFIYPVPTCGDEDTRPGVLSYIHYTHFGTILFLLTCLTIFLVSMATTKSDRDLAGLTWWTRLDKPPGSGSEGQEGQGHEMTTRLDDTEQVHDHVTEQTAGDTVISPWYRTMLRIKRMFGLSEKTDIPEGETHADRLWFLETSKRWNLFLNLHAVFALLVTFALIVIFR